MKLSRMFTSLAFVSLLGTGAAFAESKAKTDKPAAEAKIADDDMKKAFAFVDALVSAVTTNANDCDKMGAQINGVIDTHAATIAMINEHKKAGRKPPKEFEEKMQAKTKELVPPIMKCQSNEKVKAAFQRLQAAMTGGASSAPPAEKPAEKAPEKAPAKKPTK